MFMELRHLRYFQAVAEEQHLGRAAQRLHVSASPLSRQVRELESELGVALFERVGRGLRLTSAGALFLRKARALLAELERAVASVRGAASGASTRLAMAVDETRTYAELLPDVIGGLRAQDPALELDLAVMSSRDQLRALEAGHLDAGFGHLRPRSAALASERLFTERVVLAVPRAHPLARRQAITPAQLVQVPFVASPRAPADEEDGSPLRVLQEHGIRLDVVLEAASAATRLSLVAAGVGLCFALESASTPRQVVLRPLSRVPLLTEAHLVWRKDGATGAVRALRELARAARARTLRRRRPDA
jgi:DNA-binding transcriptional LysR family regulator